MTITVFDMNKEVERLKRRPTWELKAMVKALGFHAWGNTDEENMRREAGKAVLKERRKKGGK